MARSYPIWNKVEACIYNSSKSWGARETCQVDVLIGTSSSNSNSFVEHRTTRREINALDYTVFTFGVQKVIGTKRGRPKWGPLKVIHRAWMDNKTRKVYYRKPKVVSEWEKEVLNE